MQAKKIQHVTQASWLRHYSFRLCLLLTMQLLVHAKAEDLYVNVTALANGDGTTANPYRRITDAVLRARKDRRSAVIPANERITIHVAPGTYRGSYDALKLAANPQWEMLPIILNVPNLTLSGATVLDLDVQGLPSGVHQGPETILTTPDSQLFDAVHTLILITRTTDGGAGDGVAVTGFDLKQKQGGSSDPMRTFGIWVEQVSQFEIRGNAFVHTPGALGTRLASGVVQGDFFNCYGAGMVIFGGSINQPAVVTVAGNRATGQAEGGMILGGVPGLAPVDLGANALTVRPLQMDYDRSKPEDLRNIPDTLTAIVTGNDISDNGHFGARLWGYPPSKYKTADQTLTCFLNATFNGNSFSRNGDYGIAPDAGFPTRSFPLLLTTSFHGIFQNNVIVGNGRGPALFTFWNFWVSEGLDDPQLYKFLNLSTYQITDVDGELSGFDYDNPTAEPIDGTPLSNALIVNGTTIPHGTKITPNK